MKTFVKRVAGMSGIALASGCAVPVGTHNATLGATPTANAGIAGAEGQYALGKYYLGQDRIALALVAFSNALDRDPNYVEARNGRATALARLGDLDAAERELEFAISLAPDAPHLHGNLGYLRLTKGDHGGSARSLRRAFELDPKNPWVRANWDALVARASANPEVLAELERRGNVELAGIQTPTKAPQTLSPASVSEIVAQTILNVEYRAAAPEVFAGGSPVAANSVVNVSDSSAQANSKTSAVVQSTAMLGGTASVTIVTSGAPAAPQVSSHHAAVVSIPAPPTSTVPALAAVPNIKPLEPRPEPQPLAYDQKPVSSAPQASKPPKLRPVRVELSNGNGVRGLARQVGDQIGVGTVRVVRLTNAPTFDVARSRILFREGYRDEAIAMGRQIGRRANVQLDNSIDRRADIRIVLGWDVIAGRSPVASAKEERETIAQLDGQRQAN